jgi:hypothetical protein
LLDFFGGVIGDFAHHVHQIRRPLIKGDIVFSSENLRSESEEDWSREISLVLRTNHSKKFSVK